MPFRNGTMIVDFILLGLSSHPKTQVILFLIFLNVYIIILIGNSLIIILIVTDTKLHTPMYFFLINLSCLDLCYSTSTVPRMLRDLVSGKNTISYAECVTQLYISLSLGGIECTLLAIMAYDRYVAICHPLRYTTIMSKVVCVKIAASTWIFGFFNSITHVAIILNTDLCGNNEINHFICEMPEIISLSCENVILLEFIIYVSGVIMLMIPVALIVMSYIKIILNIIKITSSLGRKKPFSTCSSHMIVVTIFYGSAMAAYMKPRSSSRPGTDKVIAIFYLIVTPMLNPIIYTLRNNDVKAAFLKFQRRCNFC
ncbi:olfactory receptor 5V1-like [Mantella aurantiaca]